MLINTEVDGELLAIQSSVLYPGVAQLVARVLWEHEAAGSSPVTRRLIMENTCTWYELLFTKYSP